MATSIESVTAASKLRREKAQVKEELAEKRKACKDLMEKVRQREEVLRADRAELQEQLVKFYKYIQDNEMKRAHHNKKAQGEERAKQERIARIQVLKEQSKQLEKDKIEIKRRVARLTKYETYLSEVLQHNETEEFTEPSDLIERFKKLDQHRSLLKMRQEQLQEELAKAKVSLALRHQRSKQESVELELHLNDVQTQYTKVHKEVKNKADELDAEVTQKGETKRGVGQMRMACDNLYRRCLAILNECGGRTNREEAKEMIPQLTIIGNCLADLMEVTKEWKKKKDREAMEAHNVYSPGRMIGSTTATHHSPSAGQTSGGNTARQSAR